MKKIIYFIITLALLCWITFTFSFAKEKIAYEKALELANQYIKNSLEDENWKWQNPTVTDSKYFYTDNENKPAYVEFQVTCDKEKFCWFVLVNIDWDDVAVPIASTIWVGPSGALEAKLNRIVSSSTKNNKLYYFSPFDQFIQDVDTKEVVAINPSEDIDINLEIFVANEKVNIFKERNLEVYEKLMEAYTFLDKVEDLSKRLEYIQTADELLERAVGNIEISDKKIDAKRQELKTELKDKLETLKVWAKEFKKSNEFKAKKEEIKDQILEVPNETFSMKVLDMGYAAYTNPWTSNVFIPWWTSSSTCTWITPCYKQFTTTYNWKTCSVWCGPLAVWIIYWYYDIFWWKWNLMPWTAPMTNDSNGYVNTTNTMIKELWDLMNSSCDGSVWWAARPDVKLAVQYAKNKWYTNSTSTFNNENSTSLVFNNIKNEVNAWRPILIHAPWTPFWHIVVWFWYKSTGTIKIVRVNIWAWYTPIDANSSYYSSNIDLDLDGMYWSWTTSHQWLYSTTFNIK